jgi:hypothetical protein
MNQTPYRQHRRPAPPPRQASFFKPVIAIGLMAALVGIVFDVRGITGNLRLPERPIRYDACGEIVQESSTLSRDELVQLLAIPERDTKERVREVIAEPFCTLPTVEIRSGVVAEREAYPLEFDPTTKLVILYEDNEYAGYRFSFE